MALITALLLLMIITILGLSMFRSFPTQEKIAGNVREKERALHAATSAQQYAEWWLINNATSAPVPCAVQTQLLIANIGQGQICSNQLYTLLAGGTVADVANNVPWGNGLIGVQYTPSGMTVGSGNPILTAGDQAYNSAPVFYIADLGAGVCPTACEDYQIDVYAYGGSTNTVAVVESVYEVKVGVGGTTGGQ